MLRASPCDVDPCGHTGNGSSQTTCPETGEANCIWFRRNIKQGVLFEMVSILLFSGTGSQRHGLSISRRVASDPSISMCGGGSDGGVPLATISTDTLTGMQITA